jgi:hypothetical protein
MIATLAGAYFRRPPELETAKVPTVVILGTLDTNGRELTYLRDPVRDHGVEALLVDPQQLLVSEVGVCGALGLCRWG